MSKETKQLRAIKKFAKEKTLPIVVGQPEGLNENNYNRLLLEDLGFVIKSQGSGLFLCDFPKGWQKWWDKSMNDWMYLVDNFGRKRAAIFYKFAGYFYDGNKKSFIRFITHINWMCRYRIVVSHIVPFAMKAKNNDAHYNSPMVGVVVDDENVIFTTKEYELITKKGDENYEQEIKELQSKLYADCEVWIKEKYPKYDVVSAYWND